jgi:hypothetical protein
MNIVAVGGPQWSQDASNFSGGPVKEEGSYALSKVPALVEWSKQKYSVDNIIMSPHFWCVWRFGDEKMIDYLDRCKAKKVALLVGEYGTGTSGCGMAAFKATLSMFRVCPPRFIGTAGWHWTGGDEDDYTTAGSGRDISPVSNPNNLTKYGKLIWDDNHKWAETNPVRIERITTASPASVVQLLANHYTGNTLHLTLSTGKSDITVRLYDLIGHTVFENQSSTSGSGELKINIGNVRSGHYVMEMTPGNIRTHIRIIDR